MNISPSQKKKKKKKQRLRYLQRLGTSSIVSRTPKKSYQASHRPKQKRKQNKAGANEQTPSRIFTTENKARVNPKFKQQLVDMALSCDVLCASWQA